MTDLGYVLDTYDNEDIRIISSHDGFTIREKETQDVLWKWNPAHDREPFGAMQDLFERLGYDIETM